MMKYVFFGTPRFAAIALERLIHAGFPPTALVCNPDRPVGRKKTVMAPPTKQLLAERGIGAHVFQPEKLDASFTTAIAKLQPDLFIVAAYSAIIPKSILAIPRFGTIGIHPSLLPQYRGASPIQTALLNGEEETGVAVYVMDEKMDHGPVLAEERWPIAENEQYPQLEEELALLGAALAAKLLPDIERGAAVPRAQNEADATYTRKFTTQDGFVDETDLIAAERGDKEKAQRIIRTVNAFTPEPGAWTIRDGKRLKLLRTTMKDGCLVLGATQREGERPKAH